MNEPITADRYLLLRIRCLFQRERSTKRVFGAYQSFAPSHRQRLTEKIFSTTIIELNKQSFFRYKKTFYDHHIALPIKIDKYEIMV